MIEELTQHLIKPNEATKVLRELSDEKDRRYSWSAHEQLEALMFYFDEQVKLFCSEETGDYSGEFIAVLKAEKKFWLWRDSFGSCSGCDALDGNTIEQGYNYILDTMTSVKEFEDIKSLIQYLKVGEDVLYNDELRQKLLKKLNSMVEEWKKKNLKTL